MAEKNLNSYTQLFNIGRSLAQDIFNKTDDEILEELTDVDQKLGQLAENSYAQALKKMDESPTKASFSNFDLASTMQRGMDASLARKKIASLAAANDSVVLQVASNIHALSDAETLNIYYDLLAIGAFKEEPK